MSFINALNAELEALARELEGDAIYRRFVELLRVRDELYSSGVPQDCSIPDHKHIRQRSIQSNMFPTSGKSPDAVKKSIAYIREAGTPLRTTELLERLERDGITFAGGHPQATLSSLLSRASEELRSRGGRIGWALREWDSAGNDELERSTFPAESLTNAQGREAGPGGGI